MVTRDPDKPDYTSGEVVELTARPDAGWAFDTWSGDASGSTPVISVTMDGNRTVTANYIRRYSMFTASDHGEWNRIPTGARPGRNEWICAKSGERPALDLAPPADHQG